MMNKLLIAGVMLSLIIVSGYAAERVPENGFGIVPMPYEAKANAGTPFVITKETVIVARAAETKQCAAYLQQRLRQSCGLTLARRGSTSGKAIVLTVSDDAVAFTENDAYRLDSSADKITIAAKTERGLFYGVQSLLQLLPPAVYGDKVQTGLELKVPALVINDKPSMDRMRGLHVDISRHFRTKEELLKIIDSMAMHKLNTLHLHATDVQGWRIEIKAYPKLTTIGAIGNNTDPEAPATFLTEEEVKEIVAYANSRYISIFPEIDMPGHMGAAIRAYPELNHPKDIHNKQYALRGDAMARTFCKTVLTEINELFDSDYIHIGFDEVNYGAKTELYTDPELLDFATDITTFVKEDLKKTPIVWDDIFMHGFEDKDTVVQWWRYGKNYWWRRMEHTVDEALNMKQQPFILSSAYWTYFDMKNLKGGWAKPLSVAEVYNWDPYGDMLGKTEHTRGLAVGAIACTWSEKIPTMKVFGDRTYPRLASFSERIWRGGKEEAPNILSWPDYRDQVLIPFQLKRYEALGLHYWSQDQPELLLNLPDNRKLIKKPAPPKKAKS
jgi:hexosaminidase